MSSLYLLLCATRGTGQGFLSRHIVEANNIFHFRNLMSWYMQYSWHNGSNLNTFTSCISNYLVCLNFVNYSKMSQDSIANVPLTLSDLAVVISFLFFFFFSLLSLFLLNFKHDVLQLINYILYLFIETLAYHKLCYGQQYTWLYNSQVCMKIVA